MSSARQDFPASSAPPSRRSLLRGGLALSAAAAVAATAEFPATAETGSLPPGYPPLEWIPAHRSNYSSAGRPAQYPVRRIVVHVTQGSYAGTLAHFRTRKARSSAHYVIRSRDGHIAQTVREKDIAWHAGNWTYNAHSIGIEHEGFVDQPRWFTAAMYRSSAALTAAVCKRYGIPRDRQHIIGHVEIPGTRHTDPGRFWDWNRYMALVVAS